jgi:GNAT superfamily N-acetyltransferase
MTLLTERVDLEIVATDPTYQGKGAGSQLMRWGLKQADEKHVEAFLEASPDAVPLYERLGFREVDRTDTFIENERVGGVWYRNLFMIRPVQTDPEDERRVN